VHRSDAAALAVHAALHRLNKTHAGSTRPLLVPTDIGDMEEEEAAFLLCLWLWIYCLISLCDLRGRLWHHGRCWGSALGAGIDGGTHWRRVLPVCAQNATAAEGWPVVARATHQAETPPARIFTLPCGWEAGWDPLSRRRPLFCLLCLPGAWPVTRQDGKSITACAFGTGRNCLPVPGPETAIKALSSEHFSDWTSFLTVSRLRRLGSPLCR
jgi:hypothetical protein